MQKPAETHYVARALRPGLTTLLCLLGLMPRQAFSQTLDFRQPQQSFLAASNSRGLLPDYAGNTIDLDQNGDGTTDGTWNLPPEIRSAANTVLQHRLSPMERYLVTTRSPSSTFGPAVCGGSPQNVEVFYHRVDPEPVLVPLGSGCLRGPISIGVLWWEQDIPPVTSMVVGAPSSTAGDQPVLWADLPNGAVGIDHLTYGPNVSVTAEGIRFSPFGNAVFVRHGTVTAAPDRYSVVDLCADGLGGNVSTRDEPLSTTGITPRLIVSGNDLSVEVELVVSGTPQAQLFQVENCFVGPPPPPPPPDPTLTLTVAGTGQGLVNSTPAGVLCAIGTTCAVPFAPNTLVTLSAFPFPGTTIVGWSGDCTGSARTSSVLLDADRACTVTFGTVALQIDKGAAPSSVRAGDELTYTLTYRNDGTAGATGVVVRDTLPAGATLVDAGSATVTGSTLSWNIGALPPGGNGQLQFRVSPQCSASELRNSAFSVLSAEVPLGVSGSPVVTPVAAASTAPVDIVVTSVPARTPLRSGDLITHTINLTNTAAEERRGLRFGVNAGGEAFFESVLDPGTGAITQTSSFVWTWTGDLGPSASTNVVLTSRADDCLNQPDVALNFAQPVGVQNVCGVQVGTSNPPARIPLERPLETELTMIGLPASRLEGDFLLVRPGESFQLQARLTEHYGMDHASVSLDVPLPAGLSPVGDPPFATPTEPGATWDPVTQTARWTGTVTANATVAITIEVTSDTDGPCRVFARVSGSVGACSNLSDQLTLLSVPEPPTDPYLLGLDVFGGLFLWEPGVDRNFAEHLCLAPVEILVDMDLGAGDEVGVTGLPSFLFDADPPSLDILKPIFGAPPFLGSPAEPTAVAYDPATATWVYAVAEVQGGPPTSLRRIDPVSRQVAVIANGLPRLGDLQVEADGTIVVVMIQPAEDEIWRIDPADPTNPQVLSDPAYLALSQLELDTNGDYVAIDVSFNGTANIHRLVEVDRAAGTFTTIVADISAFLGLQNALFYSMAVADTGEIYVLPRSGAVGVIERTPVLTGSLLTLQGTVIHPRSPGVYDGQYTSLLWVDPGGAPPPPTEADLALTKTPSADPVLAGSLLVYTLDVTNQGPDPATAVSIIDPLPAGLSFDAAASDAACVEASGTVTCDVGDLTSGGSASFSLGVSIDVTPAGAIANTASVSSGTADPDPSNDQAVASVTVLPPVVSEADLAVTKTAAPDPAVLSAPLTYTLGVDNAGPDDATGVVVTDTLPAAVRYDAGASSTACTESGGTVTCSLGALAAGGQASANLVVVPTLPADLAVTRLDVLPDHAVNVGDSLLYRIAVTNHGPGVGEDVRLFTLGSAFDDSGFPLGAPPPLTALSVLVSHGTCPNATSAVPLECLLGDLAPGETATVQIAFRVEAPTGPLPASVGTAARVTTGATVATGSRLDPDPSNDERAAGDVVAPSVGPDLRVRSLTVAPGTPIVLGQSLTYALEVENLGPGAAADVVLHAVARGFDPTSGLPTGAPLDLSVVSAVPSQGTCLDIGGAGAGPLECPLGALDPGGVATLDIVVTPTTASVAPGQPPTPISHRARVDAPLPAGASEDRNPGNNEMGVTSIVLPASGTADLALTGLTVSPTAPILLGEFLAYAFKVTNFGPDAAPDVVLFALGSGFDASGNPTGPPLDVKLDSVAASQGTCTDLSGAGTGPVRCDLGALAAGAAATVSMSVTPNWATVALGQPPVPLVHAARVVQTAGADLHSGNDASSVSSSVLPARPAALLNRAAVRSDLSDPDPTDDAVAVTTPLIAPAPAPPPTSDLTLTLTGPSTGTAGVEVPATVAVSNAGPDVATSASVVLELGPGLSIFSMASDVGSCSGQSTVVCELGDLPAGGAASIRLELTLAGAGTHRLAASASSLSADPTPADNAASLAIVVSPGADLRLSKSADADPAVAGGTLGFALVVENAGPSAATAVTLNDALPPELAVTQVSSASGSCQQNGGAVSCDLGTLAAGASATVNVATAVSAGAADGLVLTNAASAAAAEIDPVPANNLASVSVSVQTLADLSIQKTGPTAPVSSSALVPFQLDVANAGPSVAAAVTVTDLLPAGASLDAASSDPRCVESGSVVSCALGDLAPGSTQSVILSLVAPPGTLVNTASVSSATADPDPANDTGTASVSVYFAFTENMDPDDGDSQYAWAENLGFLNLEPLGDGGPGLEVTDGAVRGWLWSENAGWCSLSCENTSSCAGVDYGVVNDGRGVLSGFGWCENVGWLSFSCANTSSCAAADYGVSIDPKTGVFSGNAWGENVGFVAFASPTGAFDAVTSWRGDLAPTADELLVALISDIEDRVAQGSMGRIVGAVLSLRVRIALSLWKRSAVPAACRQMSRFEGNVNLLQQFGLLTAADGAFLTAASREIRDAMGCGSP